MATELGKAYVQIIPSAEGIKNKISEVLGADVDAAGAESGERYGSNLVGTIKKAIAAAGIGVALNKAITEGAALEQSLGGIETLFKGSADTVVANARQAFRTAGVSANDYMENVTSFAASLLQGLGGDTAKAAEIADMAMTDMSDNVNKFGSDAESVRYAYQGFAKDNFTMLDNLKLGYGGTKTEMARLINDSGVLGDTLVTVGKAGNFDEVVSFDKMIEAVHVVQEKLGITGTTAKEASTTISGSFASMKAAAQDFAGSLTLGEDVQPAIQNLVSTATTFLFDNLAPAIGNIVSSLPSAISTFVSSAGAEISQHFSLSMVDSAADSAANFMENIGSGLAENMPKVLENALPMVLKLSENLRENAGKLVDAGLDLILNLAQGLADSLPTLIAYVPQIITNIAGIINDNAPKLLITAGAVILTLARGLIAAIPDLIKAIPQLIQAIVSVFTAFNWLQLGSNIVTSIKEGLKKLPEAAKNIVKNAVEGIKSAFNNGGIGGVVGKILDGIKSKFSSIFDAAKNIVKGAIDKIKGFFKFSWSLPHLKLPHFSISGQFSLNPPSIPHFSVSWYRKAMNGGMIMNSPTIFGFDAKTNQLLAGGEAGSETVVGTQSLMDMIRAAASGENARVIALLEALIDMLGDFIPELLAAMNRPLVLDNGALVGGIVEEMDDALGVLQRRREV